MAKRGLGREEIYVAAWGEWYPHPLFSCLMPFLVMIAMVLLGLGAFELWKWSRPNDVTIPPVQGLPREVAEDRLRENGLRVEVIKHAQPNETIPAGSVVSTTPPSGRRVKQGRIVRVVISSGSAFTKVPDVRELAQSVARERLQDADLYVVDDEYVFHKTIPFDRVISVSPAPSAKVKRFSTVKLTISKGKEPSLQENLGLTDTRSTVLDIDLPEEGSDPSALRVDVIDDKGRHTVLREERRPGEKLIHTVQGTGDEITVEVYFDNQLILTRKL